MKYLVIVSAMIIMSCTNTERVGSECNEILQKEYINTKHQIQQREQNINRATRVEKAAHSKCEKALQAHIKPNSNVDFRPACREERRANIALQEKLKDLQDSYFNAFSELNEYNPTCNENDAERSAAAKQRASYKEQQKAGEARINALKERYSYLGGQFATRYKEPGEMTAPQAATAKPDNRISVSPGAATRLDRTTTSDSDK